MQQQYINVFEVQYYRPLELAWPRTGYFEVSRTFYLLADSYFKMQLENLVIILLPTRYIIFSIRGNRCLIKTLRNPFNLSYLVLATSFFNLTFEEELGKLHI
jgi:hypothetical protein